MLPSRRHGLLLLGPLPIQRVDCARLSPIALTKVGVLRFPKAKSKACTIQRKRDRIGLGRARSVAQRSRTRRTRQGGSHGQNSTWASGRPEEITELAVFLASDLSSYYTGQTFYPDGGYLACGE